MTGQDEPTMAQARTVVVTGAASGIGAGIARSVHEAGYRLVLVDIDEAGLARVAAELGGATTLTTDLTDPGSAARLTQVTRAAQGTWGLVNCAGISLIKHFLHNSEQEWTRILRVNLEGTMRATHAVGTVLTENGGGAVVNIASISGVVPAACQAAYAASKAGLIGFGTGLAFDFGPLDITVNTIAPGIVRTPIWDRILDEDADRTGLPAEEVFAEHIRPIPLGRAQTAAEIGDLTVFLLGPGARSISGETIKVTGGMTTVTFDFAKAAAAVRAGVTS
ncbi:SDR family NAD(P)-dependent oxidoreductase [Amycolatopsis sp. NPDC001319]|uniref:SDR family NAD(P)-dependent oxidoreductase n=1 Tax=unclassified Amycolatopsis TaxID=2618356 RepID=UPI0036CD3CAA